MTTQDAAPTALLDHLDRSARRAVSPCGAGEMVWHSWGNGPPLVLLHGGAGSWRHWIRNIPTLAETYTVHIPDTPGLGESDLPPDPTSTDSIAAIIGTGVDAMVGPGVSYDLAGFSFGGLLSATLAALHGARVRSLCLVGSGGMGGPRASVRLERVRDKAGEAREAAHHFNLASLMFADPAKIDALAMAIQTWNSDHTRLNSSGFHGQGAVPRALPLITARLTSIWGEHDASAGAYLADRERMMRELRPDVDFRIIRGAGHWVAYEAPEKFNEMYLEMLKG